MSKIKNNFIYDGIVSLSPSPFYYSAFSKYLQINQSEHLLGCNFNHRLFSLLEKNMIKKTLDYFDIDHLLFSIRPSSIDVIAADSTFEEIYKDYSQIIFVILCMKKYNIPKGIIFSEHLPLELSDSFTVENISMELKSFLNSIKTLSRKRNNTFCSLLEILNILEDLLDYQLINLNSSKYLENFGINPLLTIKDPIDKIDKDIFWIGFDSNYQDVPIAKPYPETKWTELKRKSKKGDGLFSDKIRYCQRCCLPETMDGMNFDEFGICVPCRSSEQKMHINWANRETKLKRIFNDNMNDNYYDCMLPMSGGKDSMFQAHILAKVFKVNPLCVTHGHNWLSRTGRYNLENCLIKFDYDHLIFNPERKIIHSVARKSLSQIGDSCWHCHLGAGTFTIQTALYWNITLMIWGESLAENDGRASYDDIEEEKNFTYNLEVSARKTAEEMVDRDLPLRKLNKWSYPDFEVLNKSQIKYLHLGDYLFWDEEKQVEFIINNYDWREFNVENTFKRYKSVECVMAGVHDYANFIKRGIGRGTIHAAEDVKRGLITREEAFELAKEYDTQRPHALDFYLQITGLSEDEFEKILIDIRKKDKFTERLA